MTTTPVLKKALLAAALATLAASLPGAFSASDLPPGAVRMPDGSVAIPEIGEGPSWWTPEVRAQALAAGALGMGYDFATGERVDLAKAYPAQVLVRPGTQIFPDSIFPSWCTAAFTFSSETQISTAGHCTLYAGDPVFALAAPTTIFYFGATSATTGSGGPGNDWALVDITLLLPFDFVDSDVAYWNGPCGEVTTNNINSVPSRLVEHVGNGLGVGTGSTPRVGLLTGLSASRADYMAETQGGDSGSPVLLARANVANEAEAGGVVVCANAALAIHTHTTCFPSTILCTKYGTRTTLVPGTPDDGNFLPT